MSDPASRAFGAIEAGGTKFLCAIGTAAGDLCEPARIPTTTPDETLDRVATFFRSHDVLLAGVGIASFGPLELDRRSPRFGFITSTPKPGWRDVDIVGGVRGRLGVPVALDTDVNAAALAEATWGAAQGLRTFLYVTVGTGIGGGAVVEGAPLHGTGHPEMGHIRIPHDRTRDPFAGVCPFHGDCLEGLASGPALAARWGAPAETLGPEHPAWPLEAEYLALACVNWMCTLAPERILLGGGVAQPHLFPRVRARVRELLNGYLEAPGIEPSALGERAGLLGALALAAGLESWPDGIGGHGRPGPL